MGPFSFREKGARFLPCPYSGLRVVLSTQLRTGATLWTTERGREGCVVVIVVVIVTEGEFSDKGNEQALTRAVEWSGRRASSTTASSVTKMTLLQLGNRGAVADFGGPSLLGGASMARRSRRSPRAAPTDLPVIAAAYEGGTSPRSVAPAVDPPAAAAALLLLPRPTPSHRRRRPPPNAATNSQASVHFDS